jgi:fibro-slime domain-containing protein
VNMKIKLVVVMLCALLTAPVFSGALDEMAKSDSDEPQGGFCGTYRNFPYEAEERKDVDFGGDHCNKGQRDGLVAPNLPWKPLPSPLEPPAIHRDDWYEIPSCCIRIDPAAIMPADFGSDFIGLDLAEIEDFPQELNGGLNRDPFYFTAHWEAIINLTDISGPTMVPFTFKLCSDDDAWVFLDGDLIIDLGGTHEEQCKEFMTYIPVISPGYHTIDIFYAERCNASAVLQFGISPIEAVEILDPSLICAKKSFEDLLRHQAEAIHSFENLLNELDSPNFDQMKSFEDLLEEQEALLESFEQLIKGEAEYLFEAEFIILLDSFEDLLDRQCVLIKSFEDLLNTSREGLTVDDFSELLFSFEDLIKSQEQLLISFEDLLEILFTKYDLVIDQECTFLQSFEDLLTCQYELIESFADILIGSEKKFFMTESSTIVPEFTELIFSLEDLIRSQYKLLESFENILQEQFPEMNQEQRNIFLKSFEDLLLNQSELLRKFEDLLKLTEGAWVISGDPHLSEISY